MGSNLIIGKLKLCQGNRAAAAHAEPEPVQAGLDPCSSRQAALQNRAKLERSEANIQARNFFCLSKLTC